MLCVISVSAWTELPSCLVSRPGSASSRRPMAACRSVPTWASRRSRASNRSWRPICRPRHVHLGSALPRQQLAWLEFLGARGCQAQVSVDMFEPFVAAEPEACRQACARADFIFLNQTEYQGLYAGRAHPPVPVIRKHGPGGAEYLAGEITFRVPAPPADEVDPVRSRRNPRRGLSRPARPGTGRGSGPWPTRSPRRPAR